MRQPPKERPEPQEPELSQKDPADMTPEEFGRHLFQLTKRRRDRERSQQGQPDQQAPLTVPESPPPTRSPTTTGALRVGGGWKPGQDGKYPEATE